MRKYKHLSQEQRYQIDALLVAGNTKNHIATVIGCHKSTITRELARNGSKLNYKAQRAQEKAHARYISKPKHIKFTTHMREQIANWLQVEKLSPELISVKGKLIDSDFVSHETIYRWIWEMKYNYQRENRPFKKLYLFLKHCSKRQKRGNRHDKRGIIPNRVSIDKRPKIVTKRKRLGDVEVDLMLGKNHLPGLLVITDRASLKTTLTKITTRSSDVIAKTIIKTMAPNKGWLKTMTYDNDMSFMTHSKVNEALETKSYFTRPYTSQDKGTVENRIGVIRRFFPKKLDLTSVSPKDIKKVEVMINERPVRKFDYQTPNAVFLQKLKVALVN